ncbi:MAG: leucyl aminopeptidase, partial [Nocardioides sp.]|nr:leucyl aminopeptidase [Nocardioides sp.]
MADTAALPDQVTPPEFALSPALPHLIGGAEVWVLPVVPGDDSAVLLGPGAEEAAEALGVDLLACLDAVRATGRTGEITTVPVAGDEVGLVLLVGVGAQTVTDFRRVGAAVARATRDRAGVVTTVAALAPDGGLEAFVVGAMLSSFGFHWGAGEPSWRPAERIVLAGVSAPEADDELANGLTLGGAGWRSRFLATVPSNLKTPAWLAGQAEAIAEASGLELTVWDEDQLAADGFGGLLAVGGGSAHPPRLIRLDYTPPGAGDDVPTVVLVGKGITFDTGGLDLKPSESMLTMKRDMSGGAAVLAAMAALPDVGCPVRVVGLVPAAENAVSGSSMRPGDVIRHYGGRTS